MKYRIKVIEKNNGNKEYIPEQLDNTDVWIEIVIYIIISPIVLAYYLFHLRELFSNPFYTQIYKNMELVRFDDLEKAKEFIANEKKDLEEQKKREVQEKIEYFQNKPKKITYIYL